MAELETTKRARKSFSIQRLLYWTELFDGRAYLQCSLLCVVFLLFIFFSFVVVVQNIRWTFSANHRRQFSRANSFVTNIYVFDGFLLLLLLVSVHSLCIFRWTKVIVQKLAKFCSMTIVQNFLSRLHAQCNFVLVRF